MVGSKVRWRCTQDISLNVVEFEASTDRLVPFYHFRVWSVWKSFPRDLFGKELPVRSFNVPQFDRILEVMTMLVRIEKELDGLPSHEAIRLQSGNSGGFVGIGGWLNTMKAS